MNGYPRFGWVDILRFQHLKDENKRRKALVASRYLKSVAKGVNALELSNAILDLSEEERAKISVPSYIKEAIEWVIK